MRSAPVAVVTFIALIATWFPLATKLSAQGLSSVRVAVTNEFGRPIEQAQVTLGPQGQTRQLRTDRDGQAVFVSVSPGTHTIRVTWVGFSPETRQVDVSPGENRVEIVLRRLTNLDTTLVIARRTGIYGKVLSRDSLLPVRAPASRSLAPASPIRRTPQECSIFRTFHTVRTSSGSSIRSLTRGMFPLWCRSTEAPSLISWWSVGE